MLINSSGKMETLGWFIDLFVSFSFLPFGVRVNEGNSLSQRQYSNFGVILLSHLALLLLQINLVRSF